MTVETEKTARVHRFHDCVALHTAGTPTVYLTEGMARQIARALLDCARDVKARTFTDSQFATRDIDETAPAGRAKK